MKTKILFLIALLAAGVVGVLAAAPLQALVALINRDATAAQLEQSSVVAQMYVQIFVGFPEAQQYFNGRRDAYREAASFVRQQPALATVPTPAASAPLGRPTR